MADQVITIPDFKFTGMYYPQILRMLHQWRRVYAPEITTENEHDAFEQLLRAYALASHISNVLCDQVALEHYLRTAKLLSSVRDRLQLIGYQLSQATPAEVPALVELARVFTTRTMIIGPPQDHMVQFSTEQTETDNEVTFEYIDIDASGMFVERTDLLGKAVWEERTSFDAPGTAVFADVTDNINETGAASFTPWATPGVNDALYFGHADAMFNRLDLVVPTPSNGIQGVWEFYNGSYQSTNPDEVTNNGNSLTFKLNPLLTAFDRTGALVRVTYLPTGACADAYSTFDGTDNLVEVHDLLGQVTTPSTDMQDYSIASLWAPLPDATDGTINLQQSGKVVWTLPQTESYEWTKFEVDGFTGYFVRYRITKIASPTSPTVDSADMSKGKQNLLFQVVQGKTVSDEPLGSSNGLANQEFKLKQQPLLDSTLLVEVGNVLWEQVDNFLLSGPQDLHFMVYFDDDVDAVVKFGDGVNGAIPQMGISNIAAFYRVGGAENGNIAAGALTLNTSGLAYVATVTNPRPGSGWKVPDGSTDADLARVKISGPASLRLLDRVINPTDLEALPDVYKTSSGAAPLARVFAVEEAYGPKTMEAVVVGQGGNYLTSDQLEEFSAWLNGDPEASPPVRGHRQSNSWITPVNYSKRTIGIEVIVYGGNETEVKNALAALLSPLRRKNDGVTWQWAFGGEVPMSTISAAIQATSAAIWKITLVNPSEDIVLRRRELPWPGTFAVTVE